MAKSRNRKNHKQKVAAYKKRIIDARRSFNNKMRDAYMQMQQEELEKQIASGQIKAEEIEGLNVDDFKLDENEELPLPDFDSPTIVEGVSTPNQL